MSEYKKIVLLRYIYEGVKPDVKIERKEMREILKEVE